MGRAYAAPLESAPVQSHEEPQACRTVIRTYSLSAITPESGFRISVKLEPGGAGSAYLHEHVRPGDIIDAAAPRGGFVLCDGDRSVVLLSAGVGATPVLS